jgi:hypothetical protein
VICCTQIECECVLLWNLRGKVHSVLRRLQSLFWIPLEDVCVIPCLKISMIRLPFCNKIKKYIDEQRIK